MSSHEDEVQVQREDYDPREDPGPPRPEDDIVPAEVEEARKESEGEAVNAEGSGAESPDPDPVG